MASSQRTIDVLKAQMTFLSEHQAFIDKWSYEAQDADGVPYEEISYLSFTTYSNGIQFDACGPNPRRLMRLTRLDFASGKWEKQASSYAFTLTKTIKVDGFNLSVMLSGSREAVCEKKVTGTKLVTIPAVEARPERVIEEEVVEWDCGNLLTEGVNVPA